MNLNALNTSGTQFPVNASVYPVQLYDESTAPLVQGSQIQSSSPLN